MSREVIVSGGGPADEEERGLRPQRMADMVGQRDVQERLGIAVDAAQKRGEALGHILFDGPPGLGKTTFASCIHRELDVPLQFATGAALNRPSDLIPLLTGAEERAIVFIDEIHRLPIAVEEYLYTAMEDFRIDIIHGEGVNARTLNLWLKPFTLIGATTRAGLLTGPLRDRFQIREHLDFYAVDELSEIVRRNAAKLDVEIVDDAAVEVARRSRGTPRVANKHLKWIRDFATSRNRGKITRSVAEDALAMVGVDSLGLDRQDRKYLTTLVRTFAGQPTGIEALAHTMNVSSDTLAEEVEPFLLRTELIVRSPRGRVPTVKAYDHLQVSADSDDPQRSLFQ